ncbi:MAG TPA: hypothetical protein VMM76_28770 [Pirellulaceae bacterium]|nr:hypothetical protein [Pirellulaceae bacterium]
MSELHGTQSGAFSGGGWENNKFMPLRGYASDGTFVAIMLNSDLGSNTDLLDYLRDLLETLRKLSEREDVEYVRSQTGATLSEMGDVLEDYLDFVYQTLQPSAEAGRSSVDFEDCAELIVRSWNVGVAFQQFFDAYAGEDARYGKKMLTHLQSAPNRSPVEQADIQQKLSQLRRDHPRLSETRLREFAAKDLGISVRTLIRRIKEKK